MNKRIAMMFIISAGVLSTSLACSKAVSTTTNNQSVVITNPATQNQIAEIENPLTTDVDFKELEIEHIGNHIYYRSNLFEDRNITKKEIKWVKQYMKDVDAKLNEDVYVTGFNEKLETSEFFMYAMQYSNGALIPKVTYRTKSNSATPDLSNTGDFPPVSSVDTTQLVDAKSLISTVAELAEKNKSDLYLTQKGNLFGTYDLEYDVIEDQLYYYFEINEYSHIKIDAKTGDVIEEYYWDGNYVD